MSFVRLIHEQKLQAKQGAHDEAHDSAGDYVKSMIFGGLDGILTSFAIVAGAAGRGMAGLCLILGFGGYAGLIGRSMGASFFSTAIPSSSLPPSTHVYVPSLQQAVVFQ